MNMTVLVGPDGGSECPDVSDDDPARRITLYKKSPIGISYKCPRLHRKQAQKKEGVYEFGFYEGHIEVENPLKSVQIVTCSTFVKILNESINPREVIEKVFSKQSGDYEYTK